MASRFCWRSHQKNHSYYFVCAFVNCTMFVFISSKKVQFSYGNRLKCMAHPHSTWAALKSNQCMENLDIKFISELLQRSAWMFACEWLLKFHGCIWEYVLCSWYKEWQEIWESWCASNEAISANIQIIDAVTINQNLLKLRNYTEKSEYQTREKFSLLPDRFLLDVLFLMFSHCYHTQKFFDGFRIGELHLVLPIDSRQNFGIRLLTPVNLYWLGKI